MGKRSGTAAIAVSVAAALTPAALDPAPPARAAAGACVPSPIHRGAPPKWTAPAFADSRGFRLPYALASGDSAAAFFWVRLRAGAPTDPANKVLWVMRFPRGGKPLHILARWGEDSSVTATSSLPPDSSPGEIYPSYLNLPRPGCWRLTLNWNGHRAGLSVSIAPAASRPRKP